MYIVSIVILETEGAIYGGAPNMNALIVGRVIAGADRARPAWLYHHTYRSVLDLIIRFTTMRERPHYMGMTGLT